MSFSFTSKKDYVVERLREAILSGELEPGLRLLQDELADRFNLSPTPIREAFQQLVAEGMLDHVPDKGVRVAEANLTDVHEIGVIRSDLESLAVSEAVPHLDGESIEILQDLLGEIREKIQLGDLKTVRMLDYEFHMTIYRAAGMPELYRIIRSLWSKYPWDVLNVIPARPDRSAAEMEAILKSIEDRDASQAAANLRAHIERSLECLIEYRSQESAAGS